MRIIIYALLGIIFNIIVLLSIFGVIGIVISKITNRKFKTIFTGIQTESKKDLKKDEPTKQEKIIATIAGIFGLIPIFLVNRYYRAQNQVVKTAILTKRASIAFILIIIVILFLNALNGYIQEQQTTPNIPEIEVNLEDNNSDIDSDDFLIDEE